MVSITFLECKIVKIKFRTRRRIKLSLKGCVDPSTNTLDPTIIIHVSCSNKRDSCFIVVVTCSITL